MKIKLMVGILAIAFGANIFAAEQPVDKTVPTRNPVECEKYIKSTLDVLEQSKYANDVKRIREIAKTDQCAARDELQALLNFPK